MPNTGIQILYLKASEVIPLLLHICKVFCIFTHLAIFGIRFQLKCEFIVVSAEKSNSEIERLEIMTCKDKLKELLVVQLEEEQRVV